MPRHLRKIVSVTDQGFPVGLKLKWILIFLVLK